jgi:hypothetical protein
MDVVTPFGLLYIVDLVTPFEPLYVIVIKSMYHCILWIRLNHNHVQWSKGRNQIHNIQWYIG